MLHCMLIHGMVVLGDPIETGGHYGVAAVGAPNDSALKACRALGARMAGMAARLQAR